MACLVLEIVTGGKLVEIPETHKIHKLKWRKIADIPLNL